LSELRPKAQALGRFHPLRGFLHDFLMATAVATGQKIMQGTKTLRFLSVPPYTPPEPE